MQTLLLQEVDHVLPGISLVEAKNLVYRGGAQLLVDQMPRSDAPEVILADNIAMLIINEYLLVPVKYVLNGKSHVVKLRLTILPMDEGTQIIIGLPKLAGPSSDVFVNMVKPLINYSPDKGTKKEGKGVEQNHFSIVPEVNNQP